MKNSKLLDKHYFFSSLIGFLLVSLISVDSLKAEESKVGQVLLIKGTAKEISSEGTETILEKNDPISEKSRIITSEKSFVRILFGFSN